jgi:hypothetical protein
VESLLYLNEGGILGGRKCILCARGTAHCTLRYARTGVLRFEGHNRVEVSRVTPQWVRSDLESAVAEVSSFYSCLGCVLVMSQLDVAAVFGQ